MENNNNYSFKIHEVIIMVAAACFLSFFAGSTIMELKMNRKTDNSSSTEDVIKDKSLKRFIDNYDYIINNYYKEIDTDDLINGAVEGMMSKLDDPYTVYMDEDKYDNFNIILNGSYEGIGIEIVRTIDDKLYIYGVIEDSPASKVGLMAGDIIIGYNDKDVSNLSTKEISSLIANSKEDFKLKVIRNNEEKTFTISKDNVNLESVASNIYEIDGRKIGYIYISVFAINTANQFSNKLKELENKGIDSLIIDVRYNNGGHLSTAEKIASMFVDSSYTIYKIKKNDKIVLDKMEKTTKKYPIVVIVNERSASAAELLTGSLKDNLNATIVGVKTFVKGHVQELITLPNGDQYKITTKEWLTPKGTAVAGVGISPDVEVKLADNFFENPVDENDSQLQEALKVLTK